ncbi:GNAT family N-acetyltransferase [Agromyces sp. SYSU T00194]|uniref:GNAT family N-acetyltransferase n=1 Tax=Agromyces chitinivorans TaxID=3158560 RepID=UPI0033966741
MSPADPVVLQTERLVLDQPRAADVDDIARYCTDPVFEHTVTTPWPYERRHAVGFVEEFVPNGWADRSERTWAIRRRERPELLLGVVGLRTARTSIGYWLGREHRGDGVMAEAARRVVAYAFDPAGLDADQVAWEAVAGNVASARVARAAGFAFDPRDRRRVRLREGSSAPAWHAVAHRDPARGGAHAWPPGVVG